MIYLASDHAGFELKEKIKYNNKEYESFCRFKDKYGIESSYTPNEKKYELSMALLLSLYSKQINIDLFQNFPKGF